jgi:secondary thiamine-phosphate synthase enzyme
MTSGGENLRQATHRLLKKTSGKGLYPLTPEIARWVQEQSFQTGLLTIHILHTSASLTIQENADPDVLRDLADFFNRLVPDGDPRYRHSAEGADDMPAHIRAALTQSQLSIPVMDGQLALGIWQGIYLFEHRSDAHRREMILHLLGNAV